jgi:hypothetical protein
MGKNVKLSMARKAMEQVKKMIKDLPEPKTPEEKEQFDLIQKTMKSLEETLNKNDKKK